MPKKGGAPMPVKLSCFTATLILAAGAGPVASAQCLDSQKVIPPSVVQGSNSGRQVDISGDVAIVGVHETLRASIYRFNGTSWVHEQELLPPPNATLFGNAARIDGNFAAVGALDTMPGGEQVGVVYIFMDTEGVWSVLHRVTASDQRAGFGGRFDIDNNQLLVGSAGDTELGFSIGAAFLYTFDATSWGGETKLLPWDIQDDMQFGSTVALDNGIAAI